MNNPVIVITAKQNSSRLPNKNMLPLGDIPLVMWSINEAKKHKIPIIVSTDITELKTIANNAGCVVVHQPAINFNGEPISHKEVILDALQKTGINYSPVILLQPTSPFRYFDIVFKCWQEYLKNPNKTILSSSHPHMAIIENDTLKNNGYSVCLWDGCVAIYPPDKICDYSSVINVRNYHVNSLQIDSEQDYIEACTIVESTKTIDSVLSLSVLNILQTIIKRNGINNFVTLVGRSNGKPIPQANPVVYINHCEGYVGGRCDGLFIIANQAITQRGINNELKECAEKAKFVIVRHNGELEWLLNNLPQIKDKYYPIRDAISLKDDHLTSGCIATNIFYSIGVKVDFIGLYEPKSISNILDKFHYPTMSREIALFYQNNII